MKNVMIITYYFPPMTDVGGLRPLGLAKYLSSYGWNPIFLAPLLPGNPDSKFCVIQTPYYDVVENWKKRFWLNPQKTLNTQLNMTRKKNRLTLIDYLVSLPYEIITYPDHMIGWYNHAVFAGKKIIQTKQIDAIISSSTPITCHLIAKNLSDDHQIPWIADFRDLWTQNHYYEYSSFRKYFEKRLETKTIKSASVITTVSQPLADKLAELHKNKRIISIQNGFDINLLNPGNEVNKFFKIVYTGLLYQGKRDPDKLFKVINDLCNKELIKRNDIKIDFFGYTEDWLHNDIAKYHLNDLVSTHSQVSRDIAIAEQRNAQILLLLTWNNPEEKGVYTGKLFEYLAACRPILSMGYTEGGVINDLLHKTHAGVHVANEGELRDSLIQAYHEYIKYGRVIYKGIDTEVKKYSSSEMARKFAEVLDSISK